LLRCGAAHQGQKRKAPASSPPHSAQTRTCSNLLLSGQPYPDRAIFSQRD
jgi:hypothetical protein